MAETKKQGTIVSGLFFLPSMAEPLNDEQIETILGGVWRLSLVRKVNADNQNSNLDME